MDFRVKAYKILEDLQNGQIKEGITRIGMLDPDHSEALLRLDRAHRGIGSVDELIKEVDKMLYDC